MAEEKKTLIQRRKHLKACMEAEKIVQEAAQKIQQFAHRKIARIVTKCLQAVFGDDIRFGIEFQRKRHKTEARLYFSHSGQQYSPTNSSGGGELDTASLAQRLTCMILSRPNKRLFLTLDEHFKFISPENRPKAERKLLSLAQELGVQFVLVTQTEMRVGNVIQLEK